MPSAVAAEQSAARGWCRSWLRSRDIARAITVRWASVRSGWAAKSRSSSRRRTASA